MSPHALGGTLYAEFEAVIAAVIFGIEAAAYVSLVICVALLTLRGAAAAVRLAWR